MLTNSHWDEAKKLRFSTPFILNLFSQKIQGMVLGFVEYIDGKGIRMKISHHL